jgi:hypothetical protein
MIMRSCKKEVVRVFKLCWLYEGEDKNFGCIAEVRKLIVSSCREERSSKKLSRKVTYSPTKEKKEKSIIYDGGCLYLLEEQSDP